MVKDKIKNWIKETLKIEGELALVHPANIENGDFSLVVSVKEAKEYFEKLEKNKLPEIEKVEFVEPRFINFYLSKQFFADSIKEILEKGENYGKSNFLEKKKFIIEHTQPNPFKEFHIGHLMNNAIGESITRIVKWNGGEVKTATYHGDVGLHVSKAVWAMKKGIEYEKAYAYGNKVYEKDENVKQEIIVLNRVIYKGEVAEIRKICADGFERFKDDFRAICRRLGTDSFDYQFWERLSGEEGKKIVLENVGKVFEESDGAVVFRGEKFGLHTRVFLNSEGLPTYEAKEVGLAKIKKDLWPYVCSITITANEQDAFFSVVEAAIGEVFPELKGKLKHISHGMLRLPSGKMSSRTGDIITVKALIERVKEKVMEKIADRGFNKEEKENVSEAVAIGAIKYSILRQAIGGDIIFDFDKSISFEGDSGPYLQYTYTRAHSVLEKAKIPRATLGIIGIGTIGIERVLYRFPEVVEKAGREFAPHVIVTYLTELASLFNSFYAKEKIIDESDPSSAYKIALTAAVAQILQNGLHLLSIKTLEKM
jgi:arginyl-tRNA synthetase